MTAKRHGVAASVLTELLFDEPGVGRCLVAPDGRVVRANAEWLRSTGFTRDAVLGADIGGLCPETRDATLAMHARARAGHRVAIPRLPRRVGGRETWWEGSVAPVPMTGGTGLLITAREVSGPGASPAPDASRTPRWLGTNTDVTEQRPGEEALRKEQGLQEEGARLQAVFQALPAGVAIADASGKILLFNEVIARIWGGPPVPQSAADYAEWRGWWRDSGKRVEPHEWAMARALSTGEVVVPGDVVEIERFDGSGRATIINAAAPIRNASGEIVGGVLAEVDITAQRRAEDALRASEERLREADRRKTEFLAMLSHELRGPLAPIRNSVYILERAAPESEQATRAREVVRRQTDHLTHLVDDLLDVTRISHGKIPLERSKVDLREIVRRTTGDLHSMFTQAGVHLRVEHRTAGPTWIEADFTRIAQVLTNLLNNSMKFTPRGGAVRVTVAARDGRAELSVIDDGIGMDPEDLEHMFEPFAQADHSLARTQGGLGLGLALVKSIVELHGGTVAARSEGMGRGAEFLVRLPLVDPGAESEPRPDPGGGAASRTILVIEDNADGAQSLADILEMHGHRVRVARDGRSGIALARQVRPDVILCDIGLPDVDGYAVARTLRRDGPLRETRLVALSGYAQPEDRQRARDAGFDAHLAKPVELDELMTVLAEDN